MWWVCQDTVAGWCGECVWIQWLPGVVCVKIQWLPGIVCVKIQWQVGVLSVSRCSGRLVWWVCQDTVATWCGVCQDTVAAWCCVCQDTVAGWYGECVWMQWPTDVVSVSGCSGRLVWCVSKYSGYLVWCVSKYSGYLMRCVSRYSGCLVWWVCLDTVATWCGECV